MSYDINFWKQKQALDLTSERVYAKLCNDESVDGLESLPVDEILQRLQERFPSFDPNKDFPDVQLDDGNIEFVWSECHFRFDLRGNVGADEKNSLVDIMGDFGCPMYDPQLDTRYDSADGTGLGDKPRFQDPTPEQRAEMQRIQEEFLAKIQGGGTKKSGCGSSAAFFIGIAIALIGVLLAAGS